MWCLSISCLQIERPRLPLGRRSRSVASLCASIVSRTHATMRSRWGRSEWGSLSSSIVRDSWPPCYFFPHWGAKGTRHQGIVFPVSFISIERERLPLSASLSVWVPQNDTLLLSRWRGFAPQAQECVAWLKTFSCLGLNISEAYSHHARISIWKNPKDYKMKQWISMYSEHLYCEELLFIILRAGLFSFLFFYRKNILLRGCSFYSSGYLILVTYVYYYIYVHFCSKVFVWWKIQLKL